jgi:polysaccharide biosynthesis protein PslJ
MIVHAAPRRRLAPLAVVVGAASVVVLVTFLVGSGGGVAAKLGIAGLAGTVGLAVVLLHPSWIYRSLAVVLGAVPLATIPGFGEPVVLVLAAGVWCAVLTHRLADTRTSPLELGVGVLVITSLASLAVTVSTVRDLTEFVKWLLATSMVFALLRLNRSELRSFGKLFVYGTFVGAVFSLVAFFFDDAGVLVGRLAVIGIRQMGDTGGIPRLTGTYVEPNAAGIFLMIALAMAVVLLRGMQRFVIAGVIAAALVCTLSRSAMFSVVVAVIFLLLFQFMSTGRRTAIATTLALACVGAMTVPLVHHRITGTFKDRGSLDRAQSLSEFNINMSGSWWFGKGWGLPEFVTSAAAFRTNHVANSPLLSIYRGGIFVGIAFVAVLLLGMLVAYRNVYKRPWECGVIGAVFAGFTVVGLQLDFPVVTHSPVTMVWSVLIVFLIANPVSDAVVDHTIASGRHRRTAGV